MRFKTKSTPVSVASFILPSKLRRPHCLRAELLTCRFHRDDFAFKWPVKALAGKQAWTVVLMT
jgi:hypothetical protein